MDAFFYYKTNFLHAFNIDIDFSLSVCLFFCVYVSHYLYHKVNPTIAYNQIVEK